jgi:hypothetical protein
MSHNLADKIAEFAKLASACPEKLQEKCFELLLADYLSRVHGGREPKVAEEPGAEADKPERADKLPTHQEDIKEKDLHVKARRFLAKFVVGLDDVNEVFYREGDEFRPLYDTLGTTQISECQVRIALIQALMNAFKTGNFVFNGERVRAECDARKCYDSDHFAHYFKRNAALFAGFTKYDSKNADVTLSNQGLEKLAELIKQMK